MRNFSRLAHQWMEGRLACWVCKVQSRNEFVGQLQLLKFGLKRQGYHSVYRGAIWGKTGKTQVLPWFWKIEGGALPLYGSYLAWARAPRPWRPCSVCCYNKVTWNQESGTLGRPISSSYFLLNTFFLSITYYIKFPCSKQHIRLDPT